jgi:hypothetical protein
VRHNFLLDDNIIYHAIRGVDRHDNPDDTAARLIQTIVEVCHLLSIHDVVRVRYIKILGKLKHERAPHLQPSYFFNQLLKRADKRILQYDELPSLPEGTKVPKKDEYLVQAALISRPLVITADEELYGAIKGQPVLGLEALRPHEALQWAREKPEG